MPSTYSPLKIQLMATGENNTTWGDVTNLNLGTAIEEAIVGSADVTFASGDVTLTLTDTNASQTARNMRLRCTGTTGGARNLIVPSIEKPYIVKNDCADSVTVKTAAGTGVAVPAGKTMWVYSDGTNVVDAVTHLSSLTLSTDLSVADGGTGASTFTANGVLYGNGASALQVTAAGTTGQVLVGNTGSAPSWATLTSTAVTSISFGTTGLTPSTATQGAVTVAGTLGVANGGTGVTTSTGTGSVVLSTSPTLTTPNLGTPSAATLTNATGLPLTTGVTGTLGVANGGTGTTTQFTSGSVVFAGASGVYTQDNANLFWDNANDRLGIGTGTPSSRLDIGSGDVRFSATGQRLLADMTNATVANRFAMQTTATNGNTVLHLIPNGSATTAGINVETDSALTNGQIGNIAVFGTTDFRISSTLRGAGVYVPMTFYTGGSERVRIDTGGNVLIGTSSSPSVSRLYVDSTEARIQSRNSTSGANGYIGAMNPNEWRGAWAITGTPVTFGTSDVERMRITSDGNVGVGTSTPNERLRVVGSSGTPQFGAGTAGNAVFVNAFDSNPIYMTASASNSTSFGFGAASNIPLFFMTNNTERMRIDSSGNVGIGTASPSAQLDSFKASGYNDIRVRSGSNQTYLAADGTNAYVGTYSNIPLLVSTNNTERMRVTAGGDVGIGTSVPDVKVSIQDAGAGQITLKDSGGTTRAYIMTNGAIGTAPTNSLRIRGDSGVALGAVGSLAMFIDTSNNVGVGTSSPGYKLDVRGGTSSFEGSSGIGAVRIAGAGGSWFWIDNPSTTILRFSSGASAGTNPMTFTDGGSLGIGTSSPGQTLQVVNASNYQFRLGAGSTFNYDMGRSGSDGLLYFYGNQSGFTGYVFSGADGERMRINASGNVGIGTSAPGAKVDLVGPALTAATPSTYALWVANSGGSNGDLAMGSNASAAFIQSFGSKPLILNSIGNEVYIGGTTDQGAYNLQVNGTGVWGAGAYVNGSDRNLKEEIAPLADALDIVSAMKPVTFRYKEEYSSDRSVQPGFIAQELQEALAGQVYVDGVVQAGPDHLNVAYQTLIPVLVKAVQELTARVAQLEGK